MANGSFRADLSPVVAIAFLAILASSAGAFTEERDLRGLRHPFWNMNGQPLTGRRIGEAISCKESRTRITLFSSPISGTLKNRFSHLQTLKKSNVGFNSIWGPIPEGFPPNATQRYIQFYSVSELQFATNISGEGSLEFVRKTDFSDRQVLSVKNISMVALSFQEEQQFLEVVWTDPRLRHTNIVPLFAFYVELVYVYVRSLSLDDVLNSGVYESLSWGLRLQRALGVAQTFDYLTEEPTDRDVGGCPVPAQVERYVNDMRHRDLIRAGETAVGAGIGALTNRRGGDDDGNDGNDDNRDEGSRRHFNFFEMEVLVLLLVIYFIFVVVSNLVRARMLYRGPRSDQSS